MTPLILKHQGDGTMSAVMLGRDDPRRRSRWGNYTIEVTRKQTPGVARHHRRTSRRPFSLRRGPDEYYAAGTDVRVTFSPNTPGTESAGIGTVEEGAFVDGRWVASRQIAGDETGQGQNLSLAESPSDRKPGQLFGHPALHAVPLPLKRGVEDAKEILMKTSNLVWLYSRGALSPSLRASGNSRSVSSNRCFGNPHLQKHGTPPN